MIRLAICYWLSAIALLGQVPEEMLLAMRVQAASAPPACIATNFLNITRAYTPYGNTTGSTFYTSPAFTPASNDLLVLFASFSPADDTATVTNTGTLQFPWTKASQTNYNTLASPANSLVCWYTKLSNGVAPFSMNTVVQVAAGTGMNQCCLRIAGSSTNQDSGSNSMLQVVNIASNATANPQVSITPNALGRNMVLFAVGDDVNSAADSTPGNWLEEVGETAYNTPATGLSVGCHRNANGYTMVTNIATSRDWAGIAVEIRAGTTNCTTEPAFSGDTYYVNTASTAGGDGTTTNTAGATRAFHTLSNALYSLPDVVTTPTRIYTMGQPADVMPCVQSVWDQRTTNGGYIRIIQAATDRHNGTYQTDRYRLEVTNESAIYNNSPGRLEIDGLQIRVASTTSTTTDYDGIKGSTMNVGGGQLSNLIKIANCVIQMTNIGGATDKPTGIVNASWADGVNAGKVYVYNCVAYGGQKGFSVEDDNTNVFVYNCTAVSNAYNFNSCHIAVNCIASMNTTGDGMDFVDCWSGVCFNNVSSDGSAVGLNSYTYTDITFVSPAARNFKLDAGDTGAKDLGFPDPSYGIFLDDVLGTTRTGTWSVGFHEP